MHTLGTNSLLERLSTVTRKYCSPFLTFYRQLTLAHGFVMMWTLTLVSLLIGAF